MTTEEKHRSLFASLVMIFHSSAMQQLGKVKNPATDKIERNMEQAQLSIDMLDMLLERTQTSLNDDERTFLKQTIQELKLNYVDEFSKDKQPAQS